jgi:hypothetical protein
VTSKGPGLCVATAVCSGPMEWPCQRSIFENRELWAAIRTVHGRTRLYSQNIAVLNYLEYGKDTTKGFLRALERDLKELRHGNPVIATLSSGGGGARLKAN